MHDRRGRCEALSFVSFEGLRHIGDGAYGFGKRFGVEDCLRGSIGVDGIHRVCGVAEQASLCRNERPLRNGGASDTVRQSRRPEHFGSRSLL